MKSPNNRDVRFVVLTTQRTGSSWLLDLLNNVERIEGHQELFHGRPRTSSGSAGCNDYPRFVETAFHGRSQFRPFSTFHYLDGLYSRSPCCGYKLMYSHLRRFKEILAYSVAKRVRVVHLVRGNILDVIISAAMAEATGASHITGATKKTDDKPKIDLDLGSLIASIQYHENNVRTIRGLLSLLPLKAMEVSYESLLTEESAFVDILAFLGKEVGSVRMPSSNLIKRQTSPRSEVVRNYDEVANVLKGSPWEKFLIEPCQ